MRMGSIGVAVVAGIAIGIISAGLTESKGLRRLNLPGRNDDLPYSHAVVVGKTVWVAGTIGVDPETGRAPEDPAEEIRLALNGMKRKLELAGVTMDDLVRVQVFCSDISLYDQFNGIYRTYFKEGFPARAFIGSGKLLRGGRFELQGIAVRR